MAHWMHIPSALKISWGFLNILGTHGADNPGATVRHVWSAMELRLRWKSFCQADWEIAASTITHFLDDSPWTLQEQLCNITYPKQTSEKAQLTRHSAEKNVFFDRKHMLLFRLPELLWLTGGGICVFLFVRSWQ